MWRTKEERAARREERRARRETRREARWAKREARREKRQQKRAAKADKYEREGKHKKAARQRGKIARSDARAQRRAERKGYAPTEVSSMVRPGSVGPVNGTDLPFPEPPPIDPLARAETLLGKPYGTSYEGAFGGNGQVTEPNEALDCTELIAFANDKPIYRTWEFNENNPDYEKVETPQPGDVKVWHATAPNGKPKGHAALITGESGNRAIIHSDDTPAGVRYSSDYLGGYYKRKRYINIKIGYYRPRR